MQKPKEPFKSGKYIHLPEYENEVLDNKKYVHPDLIENYLENQEDYDNYRNDEKLPDDLNEWWYHTDLYSLQELMDLSKDKDPKDVIISLHRNREIDHVTISVKYRTATDAQKWQAEHDAEEAEYQRKYTEYVEADKQYQLWLAEQELEKLVAKISTMKK